MKRKNNRSEDEFVKPVHPSELTDPALAPLRALLDDLTEAREAQGPAPPADPMPLRYRDQEAVNLAPEFRDA